MLHQRLAAVFRTVTMPTVRQASSEFGTAPAAIHADALAVLPDAESLVAWGQAKTTLVIGPGDLEEARRYWAGAMQP